MLARLRAARISVLAGLILLQAHVLWSAEYFVAPGGGSGTGKIDDPWSLRVALAQPAAVKPGDTIWLRAGVYNGAFTSSLVGAPGLPITVRALPGERATLDGNQHDSSILMIQGAWTIFWGFEVTNTDPSRPNRQESRPTAVYVSAANTKCINLVVHDGGQGFGFWEPAVDAELYGNVVFFNGNSTFDHGVYAQNRQGSKRIADNLIFHNFGHGMHIYGSSDAALNGFVVDGNASFNNGVLGGGEEQRNLLLGGGSVADHPVVTNNATYFPPPSTPGSAQDFGYSAGCRGPQIRNNYFVGDSVFVKCGGFDAQISGNTFVGHVTGLTPNRFPANAFAQQRPAGTTVLVRPNAYESGRAHIIVYNWDLKPTVEVDASSAMSVGTVFEVRNAENFFGPPVLSGIYDGTPLKLPMGGLTVATPVGFQAPASSGPEFNVFVLLPKVPPRRPVSSGGDFTPEKKPARKPQTR